VLVRRAEAQLAREQLEASEEWKREQEAAHQRTLAAIAARHQQLAEVDETIAEVIDQVGLLLAERQALADENQSDGFIALRHLLGACPEHVFENHWRPLVPRLRHEGARGP